jgi:hypothetical protein
MTGISSCYNCELKFYDKCYNCGEYICDLCVYKLCPECNNVPLCINCNFDEDDYICPKCDSNKARE